MTEFPKSLVQKEECLNDLCQTRTKQKAATTGRLKSRLGWGLPSDHYARPFGVHHSFICLTNYKCSVNPGDPQVKQRPLKGSTRWQSNAACRSLRLVTGTYSGPRGAIRILGASNSRPVSGSRA